MSWRLAMAPSTHMRLEALCPTSCLTSCPTSCPTTPVDEMPFLREDLDSATSCSDEVTEGAGASELGGDSPAVGRFIGSMHREAHSRTSLSLNRRSEQKSSASGLWWMAQSTISLSSCSSRGANCNAFPSASVVLPRSSTAASTISRSWSCSSVANCKASPLRSTAHSVTRRSVRSSGATCSKAKPVWSRAVPTTSTFCRSVGDAYSRARPLLATAVRTTSKLSCKASDA
mmetsp:Transcript_40504/g.107205  ORF Transcript_40504/g.107205 Transcript_40504/m.107205 type:complete len:230 (+) Transcript_40504:714-1403(+)